MNYEDAFRQSIEQPDKFWRDQAEQIHWFTPPEQIHFRDEEGFDRWFGGGKLNTAYLALDWHVEQGRGDQAALIFDSPVTQAQQTYSYEQLLEKVARFAGVLRRLGVEKGDTVVIFMPMIPETVIAMLACARIGAIHSVVFGGFAAHELAIRIDDARPKVLLTASAGKEVDRVIDYMAIVNEALHVSQHSPSRCVVKQRPFHRATLNPDRDLDWEQASATAAPVSWVEVAATDPLYILYTSGTTGRPKGVLRDHGGHAVALKFSMSAIYDVQPGEVFWAASDVGWVVGHSYIVYAPLIHGCTTVLYEGKPVHTPDAGAFWRVVQQHDVRVMFTAPTAIRAIKREDPQGQLAKTYDTSGLRYLFLAGERCDPDTLHWAESKLGVPVIDHWWQTETGWPVAANPMGIEPLPVKPGSPTVAVPGYDIRVLDDDGAEVAPGDIGAIVVKLPLPPGCLPTLWNADQRYIESYLERYPGYYLTSDAGYKDEDGYLAIMSRIDDIINVAGHRLSTGAMEEVLAEHPDVAECAVIGVADQLKGQLPVGFVVLSAGVDRPHEEIVSELVALVRERIGPVAAFRQALVVDRLPKTRSGKILRGTMRRIADGEDWKMPATIDDPVILDEIGNALTTVGYPMG